MVIFPGDLVIAVNDECSLTAQVEMLPSGHFTWGSGYRLYKDIRVYEGAPCFVVGVNNATFAPSHQSDIIMYMIASQAVGWDYAGFYERVKT